MATPTQWQPEWTFEDLAAAISDVLGFEVRFALLDGSNQPFTGDVTVDGTSPKLYLFENDQATNAGNWQLQATGGDFYLSAAIDAGSIQTQFLRVRRSTGVVDLNVGASSVSVPAVAASGVLTLAATAGVNQLALQSSSSDPRQFINFKDSDGTQQFVIWHDQAAQIFQITTEAALAGQRIISMRIDDTGAVSFALAPSVTVPDLTATGEVTIDAPTGTSQLTLQNAAAGDKLSQIMFQTSGGADQHAIVHTDGAELRLERAGVEYFKVGQTGDIDMSDAPSVTVPDAAADGQALAFGQTGAELDGLTSTAGVVVNSSVITAAVSVDGTSSPNRGARFRWARDGATRLLFRQADSNEDVFLLDHSPSGGGTKTPLRINDDSTLNLTGAGSVSVPAAADGDTDTAARTTDFDSATGQVQVNGVEVGDTGWRDVSGELVNGWVAATCRVRRSGEVVEMHFSGLDPTSATSPDFWVSSTGFAPRFSTFGTCQVSNSSGIPVAATSGLMVASNGDWRAVDSGTTKYNGTISFLASDAAAWPAALPGTPA